MPASRAVDIAEKAKKAGGELFYEHKQLISRLNGRYVEECVNRISLNWRPWCGSRLSLYELYLFIHFFPKSLFLSFNQIVLFRQLIFPTTNSDNPTGFSDIPPSGLLAFFVFSGAALDILSVLFTLISLLSLRKTAKTIHKAKSQVYCAIWAAHDVTRIPHHCHPDRCNISVRFPDDLCRLLHLLDYHLNFCFVSFLVFNAGMTFFSVSACIVAILDMATLCGGGDFDDNIRDFDERFDGGRSNAYREILKEILFICGKSPTPFLSHLVG